MTKAYVGYTSLQGPYAQNTYPLLPFGRSILLLAHINPHSMDTPPAILPAFELLGRGITVFAGIIDLPLIIYGDELINHHDLIYSTTKKF
jgi:hypothetical protein